MPAFFCNSMIRMLSDFGNGSPSYVTTAGDATTGSVVDRITPNVKTRAIAAAPPNANLICIFVNGAPTTAAIPQAR